MEVFWKSLGLDPETGRNLNHATGGAHGRVKTSMSTFLFAFYVMTGGNPFLVVLANLCPIIEHKSSIATPSDAALEVLLARGLVRPGTGKPTVIITVNRLFGNQVTYFVMVDQAALVQQGHSLFGSKVYSLVYPRTGKSQGGKDASIPGFGATQYAEMLAALLPKLSSTSPPSLAGVARGGGGGAVAGGGGAATAASHHHSGKKSHSAPTCGHTLCTHLHGIGAGHGGIVIPYFEYHCKDGSKKSVVIMGFEKGSWNLICEKTENSDYKCWIATIARALREEGKISLSSHLEDSDIKLGNPIGRTPVFYVQLDRSMVTHDLSRGVLNAQLAADNADPSLPRCYKEIKAIGFFERVGNNLVALPGNPVGYPNTFSPIVQSWLSS